MTSLCCFTPRSRAYRRSKAGSAARAAPSLLGHASVTSAK
jgi:hypothetical protein